MPQDKKINELADNVNKAGAKAMRNPTEKNLKDLGKAVANLEKETDAAYQKSERKLNKTLDDADKKLSSAEKAGEVLSTTASQAPAADEVQDLINEARLANLSTNTATTDAKLQRRVEGLSKNPESSLQELETRIAKLKEYRPTPRKPVPTLSSLHQALEQATSPRDIIRIGVQYIRNANAISPKPAATQAPKTKAEPPKMAATPTAATTQPQQVKFLVGDKTLGLGVVPNSPADKTARELRSLGHALIETGKSLLKKGVKELTTGMLTLCRNLVDTAFQKIGQILSPKNQKSASLTEAAANAQKNTATSPSVETPPPPKPR